MAAESAVSEGTLSRSLCTFSSAPSRFCNQIEMRRRKKNSYFGRKSTGLLFMGASFSLRSALLGCIQKDKHKQVYEFQ